MKLLLRSVVLITLLAPSLFANVANTNHTKCTYSFFFFTFRQPFAAKAVYDRVRLLYPTAPMYILTDHGGIDLSYFCSNDTHCRSTMSPVKFGHAYKNVARPLTEEIINKMYVYFDFMAAGALWGNCEFMLHLEEDVWHNRALTPEERPLGDAGGGNNNKTNDKFTLSLQHYLKTKSGNPNLGILLYIAGGAYFRSAALVDAVSHHMRGLDWQAMHSLDHKIASAWDTVPAVLFHLSGYTTVYWPSVCSRPVLYKRYYKMSCKSATIMHKNDGNPAKALYIVNKAEHDRYASIHSYEDLFALDLSVFKRVVLK